MMNFRNTLIVAVLIVVGTYAWICFAGEGTSTPALTSQSMPAPRPADNPFPPSPPDVPTAEWQKIVAQMQTTRSGAADLVRVGEYLTFQHRVEKWRQLKITQSQSDTRAQLTQYLLEAIPVHLERGEMTQWEAQSMAQTLLQEKYTDAIALKKAEADEIAKLQAAAPKPLPAKLAAENTAMADYKVKEAAIVAQWQSLPADQQKQAWLEKHLDEARKETLGRL